MLCTAILLDRFIVVCFMPSAEPNQNPDQPLTPRERAFVDEYLVDLNGAQALIRAGYNPSSNTIASSMASQYLLKPHIAVAVERGKAQRASRVGVTQEQVLQEMSLLANSRVEHYVIGDDGQVHLAEGAPDGAMAAVQSIKKKTRIFKDKEGNETGREYDVELKLWDKPSPLKLMGRHVGLFPDRVEHTGPGGGPLRVAVGALTDEELAIEAAKVAFEATGLIGGQK